MHMADALLSPAVGGAMWAAAASSIGYCSRRMRQAADDSRVPLMGVLGAFVFTAQMINFAIPGTGSSGHLGGGLLLAIVLGPHAAFLTMTSVLAIQALFFADGGLLALGANIVNLGFFPCFIAYPFLYETLIGSRPTAGRIVFASMVAGVAGLQLGALGVVVETAASGISALPFVQFLLVMLPIHLAIGVVEGLVTAAVVNFVRQADPTLLGREAAGRGRRRVVALLLGGAVLCGGFFSWFASSRPDGLEWSIAAISGSGALSAEGVVPSALVDFQQRFSLLPEYNFREVPPSPGSGADSPVAPLGTSIAGLVGGLLTLLLAGGVGLVLRAFRHRHRS